MKAPAVIVLLAALGLAGAAQAYDASIDFKLDPLTGLSPDASSPAGTVGHWLNRNWFSGSATANHYWPDQSTSWREVSYSSNWLAATATAGQPFGHYDRGVSPVTAGAASSHTLVDTNHLNAQWHTENILDTADASVNWSRYFTLDPNTSITLSGLASVEYFAPISPVARFSTSAHWSEAITNTAYLSFSDPDVWSNGINIVGKILNQDPTQFGSPYLNRESRLDDFSYTADAQGHLSLTIFNHSNDTMFGSFEVSLFSSTPISGIPAPSSWLVMLAGLGVLAWRCKPAAGGRNGGGVLAA